MPKVHPTATVAPEVELAEDAEVGPYCFLSGEVKLARGVRLLGNNYISGPVTVGEETIVYPFACLGYEPQDWKFKPGALTAGVSIGPRCILREHVTIHAASNDHTPTTLGERVFMMVGTHVAHDCRIGNRVTMVNGAGIAGHCIVEDDVNFGGHAIVHQHCRIGRLAFLSGGTGVSLDVPPFCIVNERNRTGTLNLVGMRRAGMDRAEITALREAFRDVIRRNVPRKEAVATLRERQDRFSSIRELADFIESSQRGIVPGKGRPPRMSQAARRADEADDED